MLDRPASALLTPEVIFDHFLDRIRERSESQVYVERVFEAYRDEIPEVFSDQDQRQVAFAAVKLLILFAISPVKYKYTVRHMAEMLLFQITSMEAEINYQYLSDILDRLAKEGSYVRGEAQVDSLDNHYFIDLKTDIAGIMRRRIQHMASELFDEDRRLFSKLGGMVESPYLPLGGWLEKGRQQVAIQWQHTHRPGTLFLRQLDELSSHEIHDLAAQWSRSEEDFYLLVGTTHNRDNQYKHVREELLPTIREQSPGTFLFWIPAESKEDVLWLKEILAAVLMLDGIHRDSSRKAQEGYDFLQAFVNREKEKVIEHFVRCYYHGVLLWDENQVDLSRFGYLNQEKFLSEFIPPLLERRFPRHSRIQPYMDALAPGIIKEMLKDFLSSGVLLVDDRSKFGIRDVLEGLLRPMGLVKKKGNQYELQVHPRQNELARQFFEQMGQNVTVGLEEMYWGFRKGEYGLLRPHFEILVLALLFSGHVVAYRGMHRKGPDELARTGLKGITALGKGEILAEDLRHAISSHPLISPKFRNTPITLASQEDLWTEIKSQKLSAQGDLETLRSRIQWAASFEALRNMPWNDVRKDIDDLLAQWDEVKVSLPSKEGLERFITAGRKEPFLEKKLKTIEDLQGFLKYAERTLFVYQYMMDQRLHIPDQELYAGEPVAHPGGVRESYRQEDFDQLRQARAEILKYYEEKPVSISPEVWEEIFGQFEKFQQAYTKAYVNAHHRARGGSQFEPYDQLTRSRRYMLLKRLDQLEMISVEHDRRSIDQKLSSILLHRCLRSPQDQIQAQPACSCGFYLGESSAFTPLRDLEKAIDLGIEETLQSLRSPAVQQKIVSYLEGLDLLEKKEEADPIRQLMELSPQDVSFIDQLDRILTPRLIQNINEAFRGKVVVVQRDLDKLYQSLVHRKYSLAQTRKILRDWLKEDTISEGTFLHFLGRGEREPADQAQEAFGDFLHEQFDDLAHLYQEIGHTQLVRATMTSLWSKQYDISLHKILEIFPFLERGAERENQRWVSHLADLAQTLRLERSELFDALVSQVEEDPSFVEVLWSSISSVPPDVIFTKEGIFPLIVKEAFERLLCGDQDKVILKRLIAPAISESGERTRFQERKEEMVEALKTCHLLKEKASDLKTPKISEPEAFPKWETLFIQSLSALPFLRDKLDEALERIGTGVPPFLREEEKVVSGKIHELEKVFSRFYRHALPLWEKEEGPRPMMIQDIPSILSKKRGVPDHKRLYFLLMDGMRWDLWEFIKSGFFGKMPNLFRVVREGALWTSQPADTATQLARLEQAFQNVHENFEDLDLLWKISGIDEKVHSEKGPLTHLFANVISYLEIDLLFRLRKLPSRTLLILFSDHGFVENPAFRPTDKYETPRYIHGKDSPFEVIVPWAWVMKL